MKRIALFVLSVVMCINASAQYVNVASSIQYLRRGEYDAAVKAIEKACENEETKNDAKTWYYASLIYSQMSDKSKDFDSINVQKATISAQKCRSLDREREYDLDVVFNFIANSYYNKGIEVYKTQVYKKSGYYLKRAAELFLAGNKRSYAGDAYYALSLSKLYASVGETNYNRKYQYLNEAVDYLDACKELKETYETDQIYSKIGTELYNIAVDFRDYKLLEKALESANSAYACFNNAGDLEKIQMTSHLIEVCMSEMAIATPPAEERPSENSTPHDKKPSRPIVNVVDVDNNIPVNGEENDNTYVFIIANEDYPQRHVPYALNDGNVFKEYCNKTLGIPLKHIKIYENATSGKFVACIASIKKASEANNGNINVIFYYAGHAFPDEATKDAFLMPIDGDSKLVETCYSLKKLYKELENVKTNRVVCFLDACFSGATREDEMLISGRGVAIKPREETPRGNLVVFTSASGAETAHQFEEKKHGLFTYYLLKKMQQSNGNVSLGELYDYLLTHVRQTSYDENEKIQTPSVIPSASMSQSWRNVKL